MSFVFNVYDILTQVLCICHYIDMNGFTRVWGNYLGSLDWNVFMTIHYYSTFNSDSSRKIHNQLFEKNKSNITRMFFISEYNSDFQGIHTHSLLQVNDINLFQKKINGLYSKCNICVKYGDDLIKTDDGKLNVGFYISKFIDKKLDYDILI